MSFQTVGNFVNNYGVRLPSDTIVKLSCEVCAQNLLHIYTLDRLKARCKIRIKAPLWNKKHENLRMCLPLGKLPPYLSIPLSFPPTVVEEIILPSVALSRSSTRHRTAEEEAT